jgi:transcriptional regulator with XRE-family HTH domain
MFINTEHLIRYRESRLLSRYELARKAGLSPSSVYRIENGLEVSTSTQRKVIVALGLTMETAVAKGVLRRG